MKKNFLALIAFAVISITAIVAFKPSSTNASYNPFKTVTLTNSGTNKLASINCAYLNEANYYIEAGDSLTLTLTKVKNGGKYVVLIKKTTASVVTLTNAGTIVGTTSPISLSGSANTFFWCDITNNGTVTVLHKR